MRVFSTGADELSVPWKTSEVITLSLCLYILPHKMLHTRYIYIYLYVHEVICDPFANVCLFIYLFLYLFIWGAFAKYVMPLCLSMLSVRPSVRMEQHVSRLTDCYEIWYLRIFRKSVEKIKDLLKSDKHNGYFTWRLTHSYIAEFVLEWEMFQIKAVEKIKTHFSRKSCRWWDNVAKYDGIWQSTDDNMSCTKDAIFMPHS